VHVEPAELSQVVKHLTGSPDPGSSWACDQLHEAIASATAGIWRIHAEKWSVVLKLMSLRDGGHPNWRAGKETRHWYYWKREVLAYQSSLVTSFAGNLRAPRCYLIAERPDGSVALWIEDLGRASSASGWPLSRYQVASQHLGQAQGEFMAGRRLPDEPWLSRSWLRDYLAQRDADFALLEDPDAWSMPAVRRWLPQDLARPLLRMRADQELYLRALERFPRTVCHLDLHPANMFGTSDETVLIDWSFVGIGALGEDPGNLVPDSVLDFHVRPEHIDDLYDAVRDGYLAGLRDAGWNGPAEIVDLAMSAAIAAKYAWFAPRMLRAAIERRELFNRRPIEDAFAWQAPVIPFLLSRAEQARRLARVLS
jgi:hypothetical protein